MGVAQGDGLHRAAGQQRGLEQPRIKPPDRFAAGRGGFREHQYPLTLAQAPDELLGRFTGAVVFPAPDEGGAGPAAQPAEQRPSRYVLLGQEMGGTDGGDAEDVQPGDMVGHEQGRAVVGGSARLEPHPHDPAQSPAPPRQGTGGDVAPPSAGAQGGGDQDPRQDMQAQQRHPHDPPPGRRQGFPPASAHWSRSRKCRA